MLTGQAAEGRIPTFLRSQPDMFFDIFKKQKTAAAKALKGGVMPDNAPAAAAAVAPAAAAAGAELTVAPAAAAAGAGLPEVLAAQVAAPVAKAAPAPPTALVEASATHIDEEAGSKHFKACLHTQMVLVWQQSSSTILVYYSQFFQTGLFVFV